MIERNADKQYLLDLLVDGELADDERRELLAWCEREPDGWRRCALAFLEAQNWSQVLGTLTRPARQSHAVDRRAARGVAAPVVRPAYLQPRQWRTMLVMAASVALAFTLGVWVRDAGKVERIADERIAEERLAPHGSTAVRLVESKSPPRLSNRPEQGSSQAEVGVGGPLRAANDIQLPAADDWLVAEPSAMPSEVRRALERMGHRVQQRRELVPYRLQDGRRVMVPVDRVEVQPVGNRSYQ